MAEKRKDNKGRVLKTGELQRSDGRYQYRRKYRGMEWCVYANTLNELREKEKQIQNEIDLGKRYNTGKITVIELIKRYVQTKDNIRQSTEERYSRITNIINGCSFGKRQVKDIKVSDAKLLIKELNETYSFETIRIIKSLLTQTFQFAYEDDIISRNPFEFKIGDVIKKTVSKRVALSHEQRERLLLFMDNNVCYRKHYHTVVLMLETGVRVSELFGLTFNDIDLEKRCLYINKQLLLTANENKRYIQEPKTKQSVRCIPLNSKAIEAISCIYEARKTPEIEPVVDGYTGFIFLDRNGQPKTAKQFQSSLHNIIVNYNRVHDEQYQITPHCFRHTFSTDLAVAGIHPTRHQKLLGHSDIRTTLDTYTHIGYETVEADFFSLMDN